ncbi:MAG: Asp-tRNA(Asn)/Glu-tRNA(Gln) amidotransferase subunit GatC [bacterium]|nr:Asp-tRNA(Asn)/Glu-tRNA(Gln) amidotransferase subunit GatC [bacterium]
MVQKKLSADDIRHLARLANLPLNDDEKTALAADLSAVLDYVDNLKVADIKGVEPTSHPTGITAALSADTPRPSLRYENGFFKTKGVFQE